VHSGHKLTGPIEEEEEHRCHIASEYQP
jgi:hypothetical protein